MEFMESKRGRKVYVVGHKNPDTDSICSALAYANLKKQITGDDYVAKRAGQINEETQYVLKRFGVTPPGLLNNVQTQVKDIDINKMSGVESSVSIKKVWALMKENNAKTMPVTANGELEGLITIGDIATSYMEVYDSNILASARTQYRSIANTLDGEIVTGNEHAYFIKGKVVIAASSPELMENFIEQDDLVILGNRYESQLCALEMDASCLVVCQNATVSKTIKKIAEERSCVIIRTPHDTYVYGGELISQSIPVKHFMAKEIPAFKTSDYDPAILKVVTKKAYRDFPVIDKHGRFVGFISRRRLLDAKKKQLILVDHNEKTQAVDEIERKRMRKLSTITAWEQE